MMVFITSVHSLDHKTGSRLDASKKKQTACTNGDAVSVLSHFFFLPNFRNENLEVPI